MHTLSFGGLMATNPEGTKIEELFDEFNSSQSLQILNLTKNRHVLI